MKIINTYIYQKYTSLFIFFFMLLLTIVLYNKIGTIDSFGFIFTNFIIVFISLVIIIFSKHNYSLLKFFFIFTLIAFGIIPYFEHFNKVYYWNGSVMSENSFIITNIIIILSIIIYLIGYYIAYYSSKIYLQQYTNFFYKKYFFIFKRKKRIQILAILLVTLIIIYTLKFANYNFLIIWFRGVLGELGIPHSQIETLVYYHGVRPSLISIFLIYFSFYSFKNSKKILIFILLSILIFLPPTSMARFSAIALYLAIAIYLFDIFKNRYSFLLYSLFGLLVLLPFLDKFRSFNPEKFNWDIDYSFLLQGHFDTYQNFVRVVENDIVTNGYQLLGPLLFFIPRSMWPDKPIGSGSFLAHQVGLSWDNIALSFFAEGYINFWIFGTFLFLFILGYISGKLDFRYWNYKKIFNKHPFYGFYLLFLGHLIFILRGDLMSSFAYTSTVLIFYIIILYIFLIISKIKL